MCVFLCAVSCMCVFLCAVSCMCVFLCTMCAVLTEDNSLEQELQMALATLWVLGDYPGSRRATTEPSLQPPNSTNYPYVVLAVLKLAL